MCIQTKVAIPARSPPTLADIAITEGIIPHSADQRVGNVHYFGDPAHPPQSLIFLVFTVLVVPCGRFIKADTNS